MTEQSRLFTRDYDRDRLRTDARGIYQREDAYPPLHRWPEPTCDEEHAGQVSVINESCNAGEGRD